ASSLQHSATSVHHSFSSRYAPRPAPHSFPTRRSSDLGVRRAPPRPSSGTPRCARRGPTTRRRAPASRRRAPRPAGRARGPASPRSEEHTSELQSRENLVCRLLLEKKKKISTLALVDEC